MGAESVQYRVTRPHSPALGLAGRYEAADQVGVAGSLNNLSGIALRQGDLQAAHSFFEQSLAISRKVGRRIYEAGSVCGMDATTPNQVA